MIELNGEIFETMKIKIISIILIFFIFSIYTTYTQEKSDTFPVLKGSYLGQKPPGESPEIFAPGIISADKNFEHSAAVFSPDGQEVFWCTNVNWYTDKRVVGNLRLYTMKMVKGQWTSPQPTPFVKNIRVERPVFSPDGTRLYIEYGSDPADIDSDTDIYVVERTGGGWSKPKPVSPLINSSSIERLHCVTADGSLYFSRDPFTANEEVFVSQCANGKFTQPEKLGKSYNSDDYELAIVIAPDEEYMLINTLNKQHTSSELNILYKKADGFWTERIRVEPPHHCGGFLALSPDGKYLFFLDDEICWISTWFIDELKPQNLE